MLNDVQLQSCASYVMEQTKYVIETFGPRGPGSDAERQTQEYVKQELTPICDSDVSMEAFPVATNAFFAMEAVAAGMLLLSVLVYAVHPWISLALDVGGLSVLYFQLLRYRLFLDPFFKKYTSYNVYGTLRPSGAVKRRIIVSGHSDSACEWRFAYLFPGLFRYIMIAMIVGIVGIVLFHGASAIAWYLGGDVWATVQRFVVVQWALAPLLLIGLFFNDLGRPVPGANDNLTGVFAALGIGKAMKEAGVQLEQTELMLASLGSEEAGLRGAKYFAEQHKQRYADVETIVLVLDTLRDAEYITVYNSDMNGTVKNDAGVCKLLQDAGKDCGMDLSLGTVFLGSTDGAAFTQAGWRAGTLAAMDPAPPPYYHTRRDSWENMDQDCLKKCIAVICAAIKRYDAGEQV